MRRSATPLIFDRALLRRRRDRRAEAFAAYDFLFAEAGQRLAERLEAVRRPFARAVELGARDDRLGDSLRALRPDLSVARCAASPAYAAHLSPPALVADEEVVPLAAGSVDLIVSNLALHWVNDLPGLLVQARRALRPDGLFLAAMFGGDTLWELRECLALAEDEVLGGYSPRISPMVDLRDAGMLLQRAGFALPVADIDRIPVRYSDPLRLLSDLRGMGEANVQTARHTAPTPRRLWLRMAELYRQRHGAADGRVTATFEVIFLSGWAPHPEQQKPLRPGSAQLRLADALGTTETGA